MVWTRAEILSSGVFCLGSGTAGLWKLESIVDGGFRIRPKQNAINRCVGRRRRCYGATVFNCYTIVACTGSALRRCVALYLLLTALYTVVRTTVCVVRTVHAGPHRAAPSMVRVNDRTGTRPKPSNAARTGRAA